jgi:N-acetylglutamate synthase-like GNAT family acetyltransferase
MIKIIELHEKNLKDYHKENDCIMNPKKEGAEKKFTWLKARFKEGMKIKVAFSEEEKKVIGFIEYVPGEKAWRAVSAKGYMFIHCIWTYGKKNQHKGLGSDLLKEVEKDAKAAKMNGIAALASEGSFMASRDIFVRNGFKIVEEASPKFSLCVKQIKKAASPRINDWKSRLQKYKGLNILYCSQCPWVANSVDEYEKIARQNRLKINFGEIKSPKEAQNGPTPYGVFAFIKDGKILADHYMSNTRFKNIITKELK